MSDTIRIAHSPDADDAFMHYAVVNGEVDDRERPEVIREFREAQSVFEEIVRMLQEEEKKSKKRRAV